MRKIFVLLAIFIILIVILVVFLLNNRGDNGQLPVLSGTVEAVAIDLAFKSGGRVESISIDEGQSVSLGDTVAELSHDEILAQIRQADDQIEAAKAQQRSMVVEKEAARRNLGKVINLIPTGAATSGQKEDLEDKIRGLDAAIDAASSSVKAARSRADYLRAVFENEFIIAPAGGTVISRLAEPGEVLSPGQKIITIADLDNLEIRVYLPETLLGKVRLGQNALINIDSHPGETFDGVVTRISDKAEFTPKNIQTKQERIKTVYGITIGSSGHNGILKPGMPCDVTIPPAP